MKKNIGQLVLGVWLVVHGLTQVVQLNFSGLGTVMAVGAIVAGALIVAGR
jgi:hypothetical protein